MCELVLFTSGGLEKYEKHQKNLQKKKQKTKTLTKLNLGMILYWCKLHLRVKKRKREKKTRVHFVWDQPTVSIFISVLEFNVFHDLDSFDLWLESQSWHHDTSHHTVLSNSLQWNYGKSSCPVRFFSSFVLPLYLCILNCVNKLISTCTLLCFTIIPKMKFVDALFGTYI